MAGEKQEKLKTSKSIGSKAVVKARAVTEKTVGVDGCSGCKRKCSAGVLDGTNALRRSACMKVKEAADTIAESLLEGARSGNLKCVQILLALAGEQAENSQAKEAEGVRTPAMDLADEEEYFEPGTENFAVTGEGGRVPER